MGCAEYLNVADNESMKAYLKSAEYLAYQNKGEMAQAVVYYVAMDKLGWTMTGFKSVYHGFDAIFVDQLGNIVVVEAKETDIPGPQALSTDKLGRVQVEPNWILAKAERMQLHGSALYADNPENERWGREIQSRYERGKEDTVRSVIIQTEPSTHDTYVYEFVGGKWERANFFEASEITKGLKGDG